MQIAYIKNRTRVRTCFCLKSESGSYFLKSTKNILYVRIPFRDKRKVPYHSNCNVMVCRFYAGNELNTKLNTFSSNVFFFCVCSKIRTYFKNLNSLTLCQLLLFFWAEKCRFLPRFFYYYYYYYYYFKFNLI